MLVEKDTGASWSGREDECKEGSRNDAEGGHVTDRNGEGVTLEECAHTGILQQVAQQVCGPDYTARNATCELR